MKEKFGVAPEQVVDVLALMGDTIDNIKGVPGIGEKGARELIAQLRIAREPARARGGGQEQALSRRAARPTSDAARQSRELARIRTDVPVEFDADALRYRGGSRERCFADLQRARLPRARQGIRADRRHHRQDLSHRQHRRRRCARWPERLRAAGRFALRVLPDRPTAMRAAIVGLAFSTAPRDARLRADRPPRARATPPSLPLDGRARRAAAVLEDEAIEKVGHDLKFDAIVLARHGVTLRGLDIDTMLASYLLDATRSEHLLEDLALEHTSYKALTEEDVCGRGAKAMSLADVPVEAAVDYACERADLVGQLAPMLRELLAEGTADERLRRRSSCR